MSQISKHIRDQLDNGIREAHKALNESTRTINHYMNDTQVDEDDRREFLAAVALINRAKAGLENLT